MTKAFKQSQIDLGKISNLEKNHLIRWFEKNQRLFVKSKTSYATNRYELPLGYTVNLKTGVVTKLRSKLLGSDRIEKLGNNLLPGWSQALCLWYRTGSQMRLHRDHSIYDCGAVSLNVSGTVEFKLSESQGKLLPKVFRRTDGEWIHFDNKQPHGVEVLTQERLCICFFKIKPEYLPQKQQGVQLSLF